MVWLSAEAFEELLDALAERSDIRLTFDDGNASDIETALPLLLDRGLTAAFFVVAGRIGRAGYLDARDLEAMCASGMAIGSHGLTHRAWRALRDPELSHELTRSRAVIEDAAGVRVAAAACPFGAYDRRVLRALRATGYDRVFTSDGGAARPQEWLQPRNSVCCWDDRGALDRITSPGPVNELVTTAKRTVKAWR